MCYMKQRIQRINDIAQSLTFIVIQPGNPRRAMYKQDRDSWSSHYSLMCIIEAVLNATNIVVKISLEQVSGLNPGHSLL